jgi:hypothetical protein
VIFYDDIATAILRTEVVTRLEAMQAPVESKPGTPPVQHIVNRDSWTAADHSQTTEAAVFQAWLEALAGDEQTAQEQASLIEHAFSCPSRRAKAAALGVDFLTSILSRNKWPLSDRQ